MFGRKSGHRNGRRKENVHAPVIVGTTEFLRNQPTTSCTGERLDIDLVVLDEGALTGDPDRGVVWEVVLIYLPPRRRCCCSRQRYGTRRKSAAGSPGCGGPPASGSPPTNGPSHSFPSSFFPAESLPRSERGAGCSRRSTNSTPNRFREARYPKSPKSSASCTRRTCFPPYFSSNHAPIATRR